MSQQQRPLTAKERQRQKETAEAARKAIEAQKKAKELTEAAAGAGDPDERQKLLNQALEKEVEAETFGKTARYLQSGAFQGICAGAGLGGGIGVSLGVLTGTLVGGTTGTITGGLGAGIGLGGEWLHRPDNTPEQCHRSFYLHARSIANDGMQLVRLMDPGSRRESSWERV
jgi:hypothetical protein